MESIGQGGAEGRQQSQVRDRTRNMAAPTPSNSSESDVRPGEVTRAEDTEAQPNHSIRIWAGKSIRTQQHDNHPVRADGWFFCPHHVVESVTDVSPLHLRAREFAV